MRRAMDNTCWMKTLLIIALTFVLPTVTSWQQDLTNDINIGVQDGGYTKAVLDCEDEVMAFVLTLEDDFEGVVYTRGSFHTRKGPCFLNAEGGTQFALKFGYKDCATKYDSALGAYVNTVVVQHDDDLIFPGDLAFDLRCHDTVTVNASIQGVRSSISLVDPDPASSKKKSKDNQKVAKSTSTIVTLTPAKLTPPKEEL